MWSRWSLFTLLPALVQGAYPTISQEEYDLFVRYTKYAAAAYADVCPQPPNGATVVEYFNNVTTDTQATLFRSDTEREIVISFRGTSDLQDFTTDFAQTLVPLTAVGTNCPQCTVHNGTQYAWDSVSTSVIQAIQAQQSAFPNYALIVTGHSLGGALASIATASLRGLGFNSTTYSMGQFRTGDPNYANYIDQLEIPPNFHRITHTNDGVPQVMTQAMGYHHHSREFWELEPFGANNTQDCPGQDNPNCNNADPGVGINPAHLCYTGILIGNPVDRGQSACNAVSALPQNCSTATGGGIVRL